MAVKQENVILKVVAEVLLLLSSFFLSFSRKREKITVSAIGQIVILKISAQIFTIVASLVETLSRVIEGHTCSFVLAYDRAVT